MEETSNNIDPAAILQQFLAIFDQYGLLITGVIAALIILRWQFVFRWKNWRERREMRKPEHANDIKILITNFNNTGIPLLGDLGIPFVGRKNSIPGLQTEVREALSHAKNEYGLDRHITTFQYYYKLPWTKERRLEVGADTIRKAQALGQKLGIDFVVTGSAKDGGRSSKQSIAIIPVRGEHVGKYKTLNLETTESVAKELSRQTARALSYYVSAFNPAGREGLFLAERPAQMMVEHLGSLLGNAALDMPNDQREEIRAAYRDAIESVIKCYYFPSLEALNNCLAWMKKEIEAASDDQALQILYARALIYAAENKNDPDQVGEAYTILFELTDEDGKRTDEVEFWLDFIAGFNTLDENHPLYQDKRGRLSGLHSEPYDHTDSFPGIFRSAFFHTSKARYSDITARIDHLKKSVRFFKALGNEIRKYEPVLSSRFDVWGAEYSNELIKTLSDIKDIETYANDEYSRLENLFNAAHDSAHIRCYLFVARYNIALGFRKRLNLNNQSYKRWKNAAQVHSHAAVIACKGSYCPKDSSHALFKRGASWDISNRKGRQNAKADLLKSAEIYEEITDSIALASRGDLCWIQLASIEAEWKLYNDNGYNDDKALLLDEITRDLDSQEKDVCTLIRSSTLPTNQFNHGNYFEYLGHAHEIRFKILSKGSELPIEDIYNALKRGALSYQISAELHFLLTGQLSKSKETKAENTLNLLNSYDADIAREPIPVPEYMRQTMNFLDDRLPNWRQKILAPSFHFDPETPEEIPVATASTQDWTASTSVAAPVVNVSYKPSQQNAKPE